MIGRKHTRYDCIRQEYTYWYYTRMYISKCIIRVGPVVCLAFDAALLMGAWRSKSLNRTFNYNHAR